MQTMTPPTILAALPPHGNCSRTKTESWKKTLGVPRNYLSAQKFATLIGQVTADRTRILTARPPREALAREYTERLGFQVTPINIRTALRVLGIHYRAQPTPGPKKAGTTAALRAEIAALRADLQAAVTGMNTVLTQSAGIR